MDLLSVFLVIITATLTIVFTLFSLLMLRTYFNKSVNNPNYPPVKGTVFGQLLYLDRLYDHQTEVARKQPTIRLLAPGRSDIYTTDVRNVEYISKTKFSNYVIGEYSQDMVKDVFGQGIFSVDGKKWQQQRKLASYEFSTRVLRDFSCVVFRDNASKFVRAVSEFSAGGQAFDMQSLLMRYTLDSIFKVGFGLDLNCFDGSRKEGIEFMNAFDDANALLVLRFVDPFWKLKRLLNIGSEASLRKSIKILDDFVYQIISMKKTQLAARLDNIDDRKKVKEDILSRFLVESEKNQDNMSDQYLRDIVLNFVIAGKDTTANTLAWFLYLLSKNPLIQEKVAQEVHGIMSQEDDADIDTFITNITDTKLEQMHYLHATLTETLRLYPAVPVDGRCAIVDDILPDGYRVKKGDGVFYMAYAMGRMPYIWGEDAEEFKPERWLKNGIFQPESSFKFVSFHAGPRACLGRDFAYRQMKILSMALLRFYRFRLADDNKNVTYKIMLTLHLKGGLHLGALNRMQSEF